MRIEENDFFFLRFYSVKLKKMEENNVFLKKNYLGVMENEKKKV